MVFKFPINKSVSKYNRKSVGCRLREWIDKVPQSATTTAPTETKSENTKSLGSQMEGRQQYGQRKRQQRERGNGRREGRGKLKIVFNARTIIETIIGTIQGTIQETILGNMQGAMLGIILGATLGNLLRSRFHFTFDWWVGTSNSSHRLCIQLWTHIQ